MFVLRWRHICRSRNQQKNRNPQQNNLLRCEAGVTLIELIAAIAILGVIIALAGSIHLFGQRQFRSQTKSAGQANDLNHAMTEISTDLRRYSANQVEVSANSITVKNSSDEVISSYEKIGGKLMHNNAELIDFVSSFSAEKIADQGVQIEISVHSNEAGIETKDYQTTIYFRVNSPTATEP
jgi:prepilin-type N-terminal cleavage/methylation domain-containing protein